MDRQNLRAVLRHAAAVAGRHPAATADGELLARFRRDRDEVAFAELVRRYGRLVGAVCRHLLPSDADADDAFQATFLVFARAAGSVRDGGKLGPWLHGVAFRICAKARRAAARRARRERSAGTVEAGRAVPDSAWDTALAAVHAEVDRLPDALRTPFVLCCLEGRGTTEAAARLGWKLSTLSGRLARAKRELLTRLEARGLPAGVVAAVVVAGGSAGAGPPAAVVDQIAALIRPGAAVPSTILHLSQGVVRMSAYRSKLLAAAFLLAGGLAAAVGSGWLATAAAQPPGPLPVQPAAPGTSSSDDSNSPRPAVPAGYKFVPLPPGVGIVALEDFEKLLRKHSADGSEYRGSQQVQMTYQQYLALIGGGGRASSQVATYTVLVFKRPAGHDPKRVGMVGADDMAVTSGLRFLATQSALVQRTSDAVRERELETRISNLQQELARLRNPGKKQLTLPAAEVGSNPTALMDLLDQLAARRFGKNSRDRLELGSSAKGLYLSGDAEAVDWAADLVKRIVPK